MTFSSEVLVLVGDACFPASSSSAVAVFQRKFIENIMYSIDAVDKRKRKTGKTNPVCISIPPFPFARMIFNILRPRLSFSHTHTHTSGKSNIFCFLLFFIILLLCFGLAIFESLNFIRVDGVTCANEQSVKTKCDCRVKQTNLLELLSFQYDVCVFFSFFRFVHMQWSAIYV